MSTSQFNKTVKIIGDSLTLCVVHNLSLEPMRFCQLQRAVGDANPVTLTTRLKKLEKEKIIEREEETVDRQSVVYKLSNKGVKLLPVIEEINKFSKNQ